MRNLIFRVLTAVILLPMVILVFVLGGGYLTFFLALIGLIASLEAAHIISKDDLLLKAVAALMWAAVFLSALSGSNVFLLLTTPAIIAFNGIILFETRLSHERFLSLTSVFYWTFYINLAVLSFFWLINRPLALEPRTGLSFIILACLCTWCNDTFAYFFGKSFGKNPLFKSVSQKKTWEGFIAGGALSVATVFAVKNILPTLGYDLLHGLTNMDLLWVALPSVVLAPFGDLVESRLKRFYDVKDSSSILPGHGGLLDRIDGLLMVAPWAALYAFNIRSVW